MADPSSDRTRRHWRVLRNALLQSTSNGVSVSADAGGSTASSIAAEFFPLYPEAPVGTVQTPAQEHFAWTAYALSPAMNKQTDNAAVIYVHEKRKDVKRVSIAELLSHEVNQGVDNTGNIRTWPSEQILLSYMLSSDVCSQVQRQDAHSGVLPLSCCELGGGMAGLASLGLLACAPVDLQRVVVTDGNPLSVKNLQLCVEENKRQRVFPAQRTQGTEVSAELLRWDRNTSVRGDLQHQFDLVVASDCLFFEEFHEDLAHTIKSLLRRSSGRCLLLQPSRNGSMERFCVVAERHGFAVRQSRDYDAEIVRKHEAYQQSRPDYVADVHFPVLLTLALDKSSS
ncbi:hypothetical protein PHYPSEUDO_012381 [Phytophthora pseudosyringae]|uniref:Calmodulin-lysine N-methyltransferase n=1 Tax=Phytophthora pseudosyringae TaxID=221518 RepID=A0A8T1V7K4_9STRA|nr:hypothetical protein PHYPSEUDO_012381 [Phytophthora pseudosyringae]